MIANGIGKWLPTALAKMWGDKCQPLTEIGKKAMIKTKTPTYRALLGQKYIKQSVMMQLELDGSFGLQDQSFN